MGRLPPKQPSLSQILNHACSQAETQSTVCSILQDHKCYKYGLCDFSRKKCGTLPVMFFHQPIINTEDTHY